MRDFMKKYILALDEGTTSARAILFDKKGLPVAFSQQEFTQYCPKPSYVEQNPEEIFSAQYSSMLNAIEKANISPEEIAAIGITNQRETTILWDKNTGKPIFNAIVWQCRRTAKICEDLTNQGLSEYIKDTTGLKIDAYFSATKIKWILDNVPGAREKAEKGEILFGTVDTWLIWKLSNGKIHVTDYTNASRTMLFDINKLCWDKKILNALNIPESILPKVASSSEIYGYIDIKGFSIPVSGIAGDQQAALFGQRCFLEGDIKNTYGTGCFLLMNTGKTAFKTKNGLITTIAASQKGEDVTYALEGSVFIGGALIKWLRDNLGLISNSAESELFATQIDSTGGVYVVPAFAGLGAPYWDMYAKGIITGLTGNTTKHHIIRAALEAIAYQSNDLIDAMKSDTALPINAIKVDGGASQNNFLMQFQSDISSLSIIRPTNCEATALGAAFLAGLAVGFWKDKNEISSLDFNQNVFTPSMSENTRKDLTNGWKEAIEKTLLKKV